MSKTEFMVFWIDLNGGTHSQAFDDLSEALMLTHQMRQAGMKFVSTASECVDNVGKLGVDSVKNGVCPDGEPFLGRTSRHGMALKRGQ